MVGGGWWIPENRSTRLPRAHICLDVEASVRQGCDGDVHTFRTAVTTVDRRSGHGDDWIPTVTTPHVDAESVWDHVTACCKNRERTVLVSHNLGYSVRVCDAFTHLPSLGWELCHFSLAAGATWLQWKRQGSTLVMVDLMTWLPTTLQNVRNAAGLPVLGTLRSKDSGTSLIGECISDVQVVRSAWLKVIDWLKSEDLGNFRPTGAGQSWSAWRHKMMTHRVLVHDDEDVRAAERRAAWTGRAEAWRFGRQVKGPFVEWDFSCAYARIAQRHEVPVRLIGELSNASAAKVAKAAGSRAVLVVCRVETSAPVVPADHDGRIVWPIGSFQTTVWENELALALSSGAKVEVVRAWLYERAPALKAWADWVLEIVDSPPGAVDPIVRTVAKHWCRALIGRFGTRYASWEPAGDATGSDASLRHGVHAQSGERSTELEVGGRLFVSGPMMDHRLAAPQVMSWIMAQCRVDLWEAMRAAGLENLLYVDTDSLIVDRSGDRRLARAGIAGLRRKARYHSLDVVGTRRLIEDRKLKASGVPREARRLSSRVWSGESWESLQGALNRSGAGSVRVVTRQVRLTDRDQRRRRLRDGSSRPWTLSEGR